MIGGIGLAATSTAPDLAAYIWQLYDHVDDDDDDDDDGGGDDDDNHGDVECHRVDRLLLTNLLTSIILLFLIVIRMMVAMLMV